MALTRAQRRERDEAVLRCRVAGLLPTEALAYLRAQGFPMSAHAYEEYRSRLRARTLKRLHEAARILPEEHLDAIAAVRSARQEVWRSYLAIPDPPAELPPGETLTAQERARWKREAIELRLRALKTAVEMEPYLSAYVEAAAVRSARLAVDGLPSPGSAREVDDDQRAPPALTGDGGMGGDEAAADPSKYRLIQDPDNPAIGKWVAIAPRKQEASVD